MKNYFRFLIAAAALIAATCVRADTIVYSGDLVNDPALAYSQNFTLDLKTAGSARRSIDTLAATADYSSATIAADSFTDGGVSTFTFTVSDTTNLLSAPATNQITVTATATIKTATLTIYNGQFTKTLRAGYDFKVKSTTATTATEIARVLNLITNVDAEAIGNVVYATVTTNGTAGNSFTLRKGGGATGLTVAATNFSGGRDAARVCVGGNCVVAGTDFTPDTSVASTTAKAISDALMAKSAISSIVSSTWNASAVISGTSTHVGAGSGIALSASPALKIVASGSTATGGSASAYTINGHQITKTNHGLTTGLAVLYSTGSATALGGLTNQTTYYAIRYDANTFGLAATSTGAVANTYITLTSSSTAGPHTFTVTPIAISGTFGFKFQVSDDNSTWSDFTTTASGVSVSSVTFATPFTASSSAWNLGAIGHRYFRAAVSAGTFGGFHLKISATGRNNN